MSQSFDLVSTMRTEPTVRPTDGAHRGKYISFGPRTDGVGAPVTYQYRPRGVCR